ncbi:hypothetical protein U1Q18_026555 [Sarracenia purpurea var. burkii]
MASNIIQFSDVCPSSVIVILGSKDPRLGNVEGFTLWHHKAEDMDYPAEPTCTLFTPNTRFLLSGLSPATEYVVKVVCFNSLRNLGKCEVQFRTCKSDDFPDHKNLEVAERSESPATNSSSLSNPSSVEDESNNNLALCSTENENMNTEIIASATNDGVTHSNGTSQGGKLGDSLNSLDETGPKGKISSIPSSNALNIENKDSLEGQETSTDSGSNTHHDKKGVEIVPFVGSLEADLPITPCKLENFKDGLPRNGRCKKPINEEEDPQVGSSSKKRGLERQDEEQSDNDGRDFEYYVKVIRWLECGGHIETSFRQKFLTWYSLRASPQEVKVVKVFVDTLIDDPASLAGQLLDAFSETISSRRSAAVPSGFCLKLWH